MIELGKIQELEVVRIKEFGVYLSESARETASVLLPKKQVPEGTKIGDKIMAFIYKDSEDRLIATVETPRLQVGGTAVLEVKEVSKIGGKRGGLMMTYGWYPGVPLENARAVMDAMETYALFYS